MTQELSENWSHWKGAAPGGMEPLSEQEVVYPNLSLLLPSSLKRLHWSNPTRRVQADPLFLMSDLSFLLQP